MSEQYKQTVRDTVTEAVDALSVYNDSALQSLQDIYWEVLQRILKQEL